MHQYAYLKKGKTLHSSIQLEAFGNHVHDKPKRIGGLQCVQTNDGYIHRIDLKNGLAYVQMCPYSQNEWDTLPHVIWTSNSQWNPTIFDHSASDDQHCFGAIQDVNKDTTNHNFDLYGNYTGRVHVNSVQ